MTFSGQIRVMAEIVDHGEPGGHWILPDPEAFKPSSVLSRSELALKGTPIPSVWQGNKPPEVAARLREAAQMMQDRYALVLYNVMLPLLSSHIRLDDIERADAATVQNGNSITRVQSAAAASINAAKNFGQRALGPPSSDHIDELCIWTGMIDFDDGKSAYVYCLVRLVSINGDTASVRSLTATDGQYLCKTKEFVG
jgi:hypothetical protein